MSAAEERQGKAMTKTVKVEVRLLARQKKPGGPITIHLSFAKFHLLEGH
jgi:hypothetical protein